MNCSFPDSPHIINVLCNFMIHDSEKKYSQDIKAQRRML